MTRAVPSPAALWGRRWSSPHPAPAMRLFCFPYAGAGASTYGHWRLPQDLAAEVWAVQPPGRENRRGEPPLDRVEAVTEALAEHLAPLLDVPFAFFGHSMGALTAFELTRLLRRRRGPQPLALFVSAHRAPHLPPSREAISPLPDDRLLDRLRRMAGDSPSAILDPELVLLLAPMMRVDFALCEAYRYRREAPLDVPITGFASTGDCEVDVPEVAGWQEHTTAGFRLRTYPGGHLFVRDHADRMLTEIATDLLLGPRR